MPNIPTDDVVIREHAYRLWEADGRPEGRDLEYWLRAQVVASQDLDSLTQMPPDRANDENYEDETKH